MPRNTPALVKTTMWLALCATVLPLSSCAGSIERLKDDSVAAASSSTGSVSPRDQEPSDFRAYASFLKALDAERIGDLDTAERELRRAMDFDPGSATLLVWMGKVQAEKRQIDAAIQTTRQALAVAPDHFEANLQLAALLQFNNQLEEAEKSYKRAIEVAPDRADGYLELANLYRAQGRAQDGLDLLDRYKDNDGEVGLRLLMIKAALHKDLNQNDKAEGELLEVLDQYPELTQAQKGLLELYLAEGNLEQAAEKLEKVRTAKPWQSWIPETLVEIYARLGNVAALEKLLKETAASDPEEAERLRLEAVETLASRREFDKAMTVIAPALKSATDNDRALFYAAFLYARKKDYPRAIELYQRIPESSDLHARAVEQSALAYQASGDTKRAVGLLREYLKAEPDADEARFTLISVFNQAERPADALAVAEELIARSPDNAEAIVQKAFILHDMARNDDAVQLLRGTIGDQAANARLYDALALILSETNRYDEAIEVLKSALKVQPDNIQLRFSLGTYYDKLKQHDEAIAQMQKILEIDEDNADAMNFIGYTWAELGIRLPEAELLIKRALEQEPNNGYITDSLGWVYYKVGRYPEAVKVLERAVELTSQEPVIVEHLGDAYRKAGAPKKALEAYRRAANEIRAQENAEPDDVKRIQQKLSELETAAPAGQSSEQRGGK